MTSAVISAVVIASPHSRASGISTQRFFNSANMAGSASQITGNLKYRYGSWASSASDIVEGFSCKYASGTLLVVL